MGVTSLNQPLLVDFSTAILKLLVVVWQLEDEHLDKKEIALFAKKDHNIQSVAQIVVIPG